MKKKISARYLLCTVIGLAILSLIFLVGCSSQNKTDPQTDTEQQTFKLIFQSPGVKGSAEDGSVPEIFMEEITKRSNGRITFDAHYGGQLVAQTDFIDALERGIIDVAMASPTHYSATVPTGGAFALPFLADSHEEYLEIFRGEVGDIIRKDFETYGVKLLNTANSGEFYFYTKKKKLSKIEDFNGLKFTVSPTHSPWFDKLGVTSVALNATEIYEGLQRGLIDGLSISATGVYKLSLHEGLDYMYEPYVSANMLSHFISLKTWDKLPPDLQQIILDVAKDLDDERSYWLAKEMDVLMKYVDEYDIEIVRLSPELIEQLQESAQVLYVDFAAKNENTAKIVELLGK